MTDFIQTTKILDWLKAKLINRECGIIFEYQSKSSFDVIQNFIENHDLSFQTPVIYYEAFPEESALEFFDTLGIELVSKLGKSLAYETTPLSDIIKDAGLRTIMIDDCHLYPQETVEKILKFFSDCQVSIIFIGERRKMANAKILSHPLVSQWDSLEFNLTI